MLNLEANANSSTIKMPKEGSYDSPMVMSMDGRVKKLKKNSKYQNANTMSPMNKKESAI